MARSELRGKISSPGRRPIRWKPSVTGSARPFSRPSARLLDELHRLAEVGNDTLKPRLQKLLGGRARGELLKQIENAHDTLPAVNEDYRTFLCTELDAWRRDNPKAIRFMQSLDHLGALARPAISVGLCLYRAALRRRHCRSSGKPNRPARSNADGRPNGDRSGLSPGGIAGGGEAILGASSEGVRQAAGPTLPTLSRSLRSRTRPMARRTVGKGTVRRITRQSPNRGERS